MVAGSFRRVGKRLFVGSYMSLLSFVLLVGVSLCSDDFSIRLLWLSTTAQANDDLFGIVHAAVTDLDGVAVEDFPKFVVFRELVSSCRHRNKALLRNN